MLARAALIALCLALAPALFPAPAAGAEPPAKPPAVLEGDEVLVTAEHLERDARERIVVGEGAVTIRHREMRLVADRVVYNEQTKGVVADGNVVLDSGADRLQGEHLELNLETRVGFLEHAQGFVQTYYFTGERIEKRGPDHYFLRGGSFTTCEGVMPDWSFHATTTEVTIDEYLHAWNPTLRIKRLPVLYFPYAVFPIKRDRSTGLLIPAIGLRGVDGFTVRNAFYWAPRDNFDATLGVDFLEKTGWGASGEMRYLLAPRTQGVVNAYYLRNTRTDAERWSLATRNSQELPLGIHAEIEAFFQSDREFIATQGKTIEERSSERTTSSFFINRNWSAWNFSLAGRNEISLITEKRTTLTRFPELTIDRTSTRLFGTDLFLKVAASGVVLKRDNTTTELSTTRLHVSPEMTWPVSLGSAARIIPSAGYAWTRYSENTLGAEETRSIPYFKLALEGPRPYRIWDLSEGGRFTKLKHLVEPRISYVYTPEVNQDSIPRFDSLDLIPQANRMEYSLINTLYAKVRAGAAVPAAVPTPAAPSTTALGAASTVTPVLTVLTDLAASGEPGEPVPPGSPGQLTTTQELLWIKLSQNYTFDSGAAVDVGQNFTPVEWEVRTRPLAGLDVSWRGNYDVYGKGIGYHNLSLSWKIAPRAALHGDWRSTRDSDQDFLDLGGNVSLGSIDIQARSRYNLAEKTFVENRISLKYVSQCWDVTLGYVKWTTEYEYSLAFSLKGIGTIVKI
jgi:LPS-assembly protein